MKVLIMHHQMGLYGGAELVVVRLAQYLQEHGHQACILAANTASHLEYEGLDIVTPSKEVGWHLWSGNVSSIREIYGVYTSLKHLCKERMDSFDVINVHNFPALWAVPRHRKVVWMCNEVPDLWHNAKTGGLANKLFDVGRLGDKLLSRSKSPSAIVPDLQSAERFYRRYKLVPDIIPYGIDGELFSQDIDLGRSSNFTILQPSMISPAKNQLDTLKAATLLRYSIPNLRVIFAGYREPNNPYSLQLDKYIADHHLNATFTGYVSKVGLRGLYNAAHVAVFPGKGQGSWLGPFEALAAGCPVVVSPNLSCSSIINTRGIVTDNLVGAVQTIYADYELFQQQALVGREFVLKNLTWDKFGEKFLEVLERA